MSKGSGTKHKLLQTAIDLISENSYGSTSLDDICHRAGVNKGSFYYAFKTKSDLAVAALELYWDSKRACMDGIFSCQVPPLERIKRYCHEIVQAQRDKFESTGKVIGCTLCIMGSELSTQDESIRQKAEELGDRDIRYLAATIRDLMDGGKIARGDPAEIAKGFFCYVSGLLLQARIRNDLGVLEGIEEGASRFLGVSLD